jgi:PAS domain-containing protein
VAHIELSIQDPTLALPQGSLDLWAYSVRVASEPCIVLNNQGFVVAASPGCADLFGIDVDDLVQRRLVNGVMRLLDFSARRGVLPESEVEKIPPLLALRSGSLARGLMRVAVVNSPATTVDAVSIPLRDRSTVLGSLTFFAPVGS